MKKYYKTRRVELSFQYLQGNKPIVQLTITAANPERLLHSAECATLRQPIIVDLCCDNGLLEGLIQHLKTLSISQSGHYIDPFQSADTALITRGPPFSTYTETTNLEPIFTAMGMDKFEIMATSVDTIRAACNEIQYGFNGSVFYLKAPAIVQFPAQFTANFIEITQSEYQLLLAVE